MRVPGPILHTERLYLQTPRTRDVREVYRWCRDPAITRYMTWDRPTGPKPTAQFVREACRDQRAGRGLEYVMHDRASGGPIGCCGIHHIDRTVHLKAEMGYWIARPYWGRGLVTEAMRTLISHALTELDLQRVYAYVFAGNARSVQVLEALGFQREGTLRKHYRKNGRTRDAHLYGLLHSDPAARRIVRDARQAR